MIDRARDGTNFWKTSEVGGSGSVAAEKGDGHAKTKNVSQHSTEFLEY